MGVPKGFPTQSNFSVIIKTFSSVFVSAFVAGYVDTVYIKSIYGFRDILFFYSFSLIPICHLV